MTSSEHSIPPIYVKQKKCVLYSHGGYDGGATGDVK